MENRLVFTSAPDAAQIALNELLRSHLGARLLRWLEPGTGYIELESDFTELADYLRTNHAIFIRHICPVQMEFRLGDSKEDDVWLEFTRPRIVDVDLLRLAADRLMNRLTQTESFSVQARVFGERWGLTTFDIQSALSDHIQGRGYVLDVQTPRQVVSIECGTEFALIGVSNARDNLSSWTGGMRRYAKDDARVSRAEFKLLEAIEVFDIPMPAQGTALDLGAAPGGWTRVIRQFGLKVVAVDPALLSPVVTADQGVHHLRETAEAYFRECQEQFDLIVNDMKMDVRDSVSLMGQASNLLQPTGVAVMTLKLPASNQQRIVSSAVDKLQRWYHIVGIRQLFHNRSEVTVVLKRA